MTKRSENELSAQVGLVNNLRGELGKEFLTFMLAFRSFLLSFAVLKILIKMLTKPAKKKLGNKRWG